MNEEKVKVPVASHGLHRHEINSVPILGTLNFFEPVPYVVKEFCKGESIDLNPSIFNRAVVPLNDPAMVTGKVNIRGFYCPKTFVFKGWYDFDQKVKHTYSDGSSAYISRCRYVNSRLMTSQFVSLNTLVSSGTSSNYDIVVAGAGGAMNYYLLTDLGARVQKIFNALGYSFTWNVDPANEDIHNCMKILAFVKVMMDHYSPKQYANQVSAYQYAKEVIEADTASSIHVDELHLINMVAHYANCFYESSLFDIAFDSPVGPNSGPNDITAQDPTIAAANNANIAQNSTGTPYVNLGSNYLTKWVVDQLNNITNFLQRHRLAGGRVAERFLVSRGLRLSKDIDRTSYYLGSFSCPLQVSDVEDNTSNNLGELAGKMVASSSNMNINFNQSFEDDGYFFIIVSIVPDCSLPVYNDPDVYCTKPLDFYHAEYDKLGPVDIPQSVLLSTNHGNYNSTLRSQTFAFLTQYYHRALFPARLFGDFRIPSRSGLTYSQYHAFRDLATYFQNNSQSIAHSYDFLRTQLDYTQYMRLFNSTKADPFMLLMHCDGHMMLNKLPLGDSYDWSDDEFNKKVEIVSSGNVN